MKKGLFEQKRENSSDRYFKGSTYKLSESNSLDVLTQINKSQAKEIEGLKEGLKLIKEYSMGFGVYSDVALMACDPRCNKIMDKLFPKSFLYPTICCEELLKEVM